MYKELSLQSLGITAIPAADSAWLSQKSLGCWCSLMMCHGKNQLIQQHLSVVSGFQFTQHICPA